MSDRDTTATGPDDEPTVPPELTADQPDALHDPEVDEVAEGDPEDTEYELRSMPDEANPQPGDPGSQMNF